MATVCARARQKVISGSSPRLAGRTWCSMFERRRTCSTSACVLDPVRRSSVRVPKPCCSVRLRPASTVIASTPVSGCDQVDRDGGRTRTLVTGSSRPRIHRAPRGDQAVRRRPPCVPGCAERWQGLKRPSAAARGPSSRSTIPPPSHWVILAPGLPRSHVNTWSQMGARTQQ